ncbi:hypothetical protein H0A36_05800 [Endozoicomonas sp. SM1973]|uniref:Uncharacterized protein n=1 Tax=Spartinivicinus marinus TaxID=2994442 RepID=A0A853I7H9_9GAMM|nr:hypothetical protein [Spartinivicinus marinus]MCX4028900.1 hypothetical protein [Spartinivicinus marinus]NYZ65517.1 hypothetical protein [Spartinivicinus marinus]
MNSGRETNTVNRVVIQIPIIHTQVDLGSLAASVSQTQIHQQGQQAWAQQQALITQAWNEIKQFVHSLQLNFAKVKLYQDGLPICGKEQQIVRDLAEQGSINHQLLLDLMAKGATLMGTESSELLREEYQFTKVAITQKHQQHTLEKAKQLLLQRDQFIAERINSTLAEQETAIIFLGMLHSLSSLLANDIQLINPIADAQNNNQ